MSFQTLHYGFWAEWVNPQKVTFDGPNKLMLINAGVTDIDVEVDLYSDWKEWVRVRDRAKYEMAMRTVGGDPTTGGRALGATFFLMNGWRIRTWEGDHRLVVNGNLYTDEGDPPFIPVIGPYTTIIESNVSNLIDRLSGLDNLALVPSLPTQEWTADRFGELDVQLDSFEVLLASTASLTDVQLDRLEALLRNRRETDPVTGRQRVYATNSTTVLFEGELYEDVAGTQPYRGQGAERADRLEDA